MQFNLLSTPITQVSCNTLLLTIYEESLELDTATTLVDNALSGHITTLLKEEPTCGKYGEITTIHTFGAIAAKRIMLLGMGKKIELTIDKVRALSGIIMRSAQKQNTTSAALLLSSFMKEDFLLATVAQTIVEGALLGTYQFNHYKTTKPLPFVMEELILLTKKEEDIVSLQPAIELGRILGESVNFSRDLVNHPAKHMTPNQLAIHAKEIGLACNLETTILERADMEKENMHALLAVAQGSCQPPKMIVLKYTGNPASTQMTAFVGKGVTFDSGGISIKPSLNMGEMKGDMAGGATVLGTMLAIGKIKPKVNIMGIIPCTENMPSGHAFKPGDVISSMSGKTIEIITTDAEGRLILADAITYGIKLGATHIIDVATLTGACVIALGHVTTGLISNNSSFCQQLLHAAQHAGEKMWELPNFIEYKEQLKSDIADFKNAGGREAGTITAGLFIAEFTQELPWVHMDIAGTSDSSKNTGYQVKGATGVGVRTLVQLAQNLSTHES